MANTEELTVEVTAKLTVSDETAKRCMALLEMWMDDNQDKNIVCDLVPCKDMMHHRLRIVDLPTTGPSCQREEAKLNDITEKDILMSCRYAIGRMLERGSVEYIRNCNGEWRRTNWFDVIDEIDNRLSKIESEGATDNA